MAQKKEIPTVPFLLRGDYHSRQKRNIAWLFPEHLKQMIAYKWRTLTSNRRAFPDFIIIGEPKCGTTSLFNYLMQSPDAVLPMCKEIHYFDLILHMNTPWKLPNLRKKHLIESYRNEYKSFFPLLKKIDSPAKFTGEANPSLLRHGGTHGIMKCLLPEKTKFIVILRNPVNQSRSEYYYKWYFEGMSKIILSFDEHVEQVDLEVERKKYSRFSDFFKCLSIRVGKGLNFEMKTLDTKSIVPSIMYTPCYADLLSTWYETFPVKDRLLIISFEDLVNSPQKVIDQAMDHLEKPRFKLKTAKNYKPTASYDSRNNPPMKKETREKLKELFKPYNEKLYDLTGRDFGWDS